MLSPDTSVVALRETVFSDLGEEVAILNMRSGEYFGLNAVGAYIWQLIQQPRTLAEICTAVEQTFDVSHARCAHDVQTLVGELRAQRLVEIRGES